MFKNVRKIDERHTSRMFSWDKRIHTMYWRLRENFISVNIVPIVKRSIYLRVRCNKKKEKQKKSEPNAVLVEIFKIKSMSMYSEFHETHSRTVDFRKFKLRINIYFDKNPFLINAFLKLRKIDGSSSVIFSL